MMEPIILPRISDQKPLVSVVSVTYNHEPYLRDCLEGFLMQKTNFPIEIIIHDDASTDHTADIIREYYEKRPDLFHVIIERENLYSQHKPIVMPLYRKAQGKYIAICEGDDYWTDPFKLQKQFDFLEKNNKYIAVVHRYDVINKSGARQNTITFGYYEKEQSGQYLLEDLKKDHRLPSQLATLLFRNLFFDSNYDFPNWLRSIRIPGDMRLYVLLLLEGPIFRMPETMSVYRYVVELGGNSWTSRQLELLNPYERWKSFCDLEQHLSEYVKDFNLDKRKVMYSEYMLLYALKHPSMRNMHNLIILFSKQRGVLRYFAMRVINYVRKHCIGSNRKPRTFS